MCYSKYWQTEDERRQREAKTKEAEAKRAATVKTMLADVRRLQAARECPCEVDRRIGVYDEAPFQGRFFLA
jgi:hypothetical protein